MEGEKNKKSRTDQTRYLAFQATRWLGVSTKTEQTNI